MASYCKTCRQRTERRRTLPVIGIEWTMEPPLTLSDVEPVNCFTEPLPGVFHFEIKDGVITMTRVEGSPDGDRA